MVVAFEGPRRAWILLAGRHDDQDPVLNVYAELYRLLGVDPPDSAGRGKPPCCDESTDLPPVLGAAVAELVERAQKYAGQGASRHSDGNAARSAQRVAARRAADRNGKTSRLFLVHCRHCPHAPQPTTVSRLMARYHAL